MIRRRYLRNRARGNIISYPGLIAAWLAAGKTNDDEDRAILKDLTGNGHDITLNRFAFNTEGSGYGNPEYPDALIFDRANDYGINKGMPILTDYTVIAKKVWLGIETTQFAFISKRVVPKVFFSEVFNFVANKGDSFRVFMKSDKNDGFYLQSGLDGIPLFSLSMEVSDLEEVPKLSDIKDIVFTKAGKPVDDTTKYSISIDVDTNKITVITK